MTRIDAILVSQLVSNKSNLHQTQSIETEFQKLIDQLILRYCQMSHLSIRLTAVAIATFHSDGTTDGVVFFSFS